MASEQQITLEVVSSDDSDSMSEEWNSGVHTVAGAGGTSTTVAAGASAAGAAETAGGGGALPRAGGDGFASHRLRFVPPPHADLILRSEDGEEFQVRKAYLELSSMVFRDMLQINAEADIGAGGSRKRKKVGATPAPPPPPPAPVKREVKHEGGRDVDSDEEGRGGSAAATGGGESTRTPSTSPAPVGDSDLPTVDVQDSAKDLNLFLIAVHNQFSLNESLAIEEVELLLRLADKYESSAVTVLAFFHLQPLVPRQFNRALALGTLYKHFNTVRLAIKYQRSSPIKMKGIPQDLFVQLSSSQLYALLQVEASTNQANYRSPDWPKLAKDLGIDLPYST